MGDRIVTEPFLDDIIGYLVTATHGRPYVQVHNLIAAIRGLPEVVPPKPYAVNRRKKSNDHSSILS